MKYCGINQVRESVESADVKNIIVFTPKKGDSPQSTTRREDTEKNYDKQKLK